MRKSILTAAVLVGVLAMFQSTILGHGSSSGEKSAGEPAPNTETLLKTVLEGVDNREVTVSRVTIPPKASLPKHWHPGEVFAYILEGTITLWQKGNDDIVGKQGDIIKIPSKQVHAAITKDEGATVLVFRVLEQGQPERFLVEDN